jgi:hypothetical protein
LLTHPESVSPFCVQDFIICNDQKERIFEKTGNYLSRQTIHFEQPLNTQSLSIHLKAPHEHVPAALMEVRCYK